MKSFIPARENQVPKFRCPVCGGFVLQQDLIVSHRLIEGSLELLYDVVVLCRACRDKELYSDF